MATCRFSRTRPLALCLLLFAPSIGIADSHKNHSTRNCLADSAAWVAQDLPVPGVVAGNAIWFDYNNDGRLDILMAGMSESGPVSGIYRNDSTGFVNIKAGICPLISERGLSWADIDNDGDLDFAIEGRTDTTSGQALTIVYRNDETSFVNLHANVMNLNGGSVTWIDSDNDGHLDLMISGSPDAGYSFETKLYRLINGQFYEVPSYFPGVWGSSIAWTDFEPDGYPDVVISGYGFGAQTRLFRNSMYQGVIGFEEVYAPVEGQTSFTAVNSGGLIWFDYNNDGFPDLLVTGTGYGGPAVAELYRNTQNAMFTRDTIALKGVCVSAVAVGDYDNDGYSDLAISGADDFATGSNPTTRIYHNEGGKTFVDIGASLVGTWFGSLDWGDYDRDGRLDLLVTGATVPRTHPTYGADLGPITVLYRNTVTVGANSAPSTPDGLNAQVSGQNVTLKWDPSTDVETDQQAITYNLMVGTEPGKFDIISPLSNTGSGFRRLPKPGSQGVRSSSSLTNLAPGTYFWRVQAIDNQYAGSSFSNEGTFTLTATSAREESVTPEAFQLEQNYPNPFNPTTTIRFAIAGVVAPSGAFRSGVEGPASTNVHLVVYDPLGREVAVLVDEYKGPGVYNYHFDGSGLSSGIYICRMTAGDFISSMKMLLMK
jgi:hypothetical protein